MIHNWLISSWVLALFTVEFFKSLLSAGIHEVKRIFFGSIMGVAAFLVPVGLGAQSLSIPAPDYQLCDPFLQELDQDDDDDDLIEEYRVRDYAREVRETLTSEQAVMDALYEEKWDLKTGETIERFELCQNEPSYVVHWSHLTAKSDDGAIKILAEGPFSFSKDNSFQFVFEQRPYVGNWSFENGQMVMTADWLNNGKPVTAPVEAVDTPVEVHFVDGTVEKYDEKAIVVGWFRFLRSETTAKGEFRDCACPIANTD